MNIKSGKPIKIEGHTCDIGSEMYNFTLSEKRAIACQQYLIQKGISNVKIAIQALGKDAPIVGNTSEESREKNRCAVIFVIE